MADNDGNSIGDCPLVRPLSWELEESVDSKAMQEGLRERIPFYEKDSESEEDHNQIDGTGCASKVDASSDSTMHRDPSLFEEIRSDGEAAFRTGKQMLSDTKDKAEHLIRRVIDGVWKPHHFHHLPDWLRDNDYLVSGHRPQIESFTACFKSIFRIHTETGNIWTHMIGLFLFVAIACYFWIFEKFPAMEKWAISAFFAGAVLCMAFSTLFHTVYCHSQRVGRLFGKLDYCGIALLTLGSFVPWLHFGFYCKSVAKLMYIVVISVLASVAIVVSLWDKFSEPEYRTIRAGVFVALGLSGVIPTVHYVAAEGWWKSVNEGSLIYLVLMGVLYVAGAMLYAARIPERWFPGRFDIWFQSHQIFHVLVVAAAFIHYHGISLMASHRFNLGVTCPPV